MITTRAELDAAILDGGDILCDASSPIELTSPVVIERPVRLLGGRFHVPAGPGFEITSSDVELSGVHITGGRETGGYDITQKLVHAIGAQEQPLSGIRVTNCRMQDSRGDNVWLTWCEDSQVADNIIESFLYSGVLVISGNRIAISNNLVRGASLSPGVVNPYGIAVTDAANTAAARSRNCSIVGNHVSAIEWEGIDTHGGDRITIIGNHVSGCPRGIALVTGNSSRLFAPTNCVVTGNTVDGSGGTRPALAGVYLGGIAGSAASATVVGNQIVGYGTAPDFVTSYWARAETYIGANSAAHVPWTPIELGDDFIANGTYTPMYMVDGNQGFVRGGVIPKSGGVGGATPRTAIGRLPNAAAWPTSLVFLGLSKGSNKAAGNGQLAVNPSGELLMLYGSGTDTYTYWLHGSYPTA